VSPDRRPLKKKGLCTLRWEEIKLEAGAKERKRGRGGPELERENEPWTMVTLDQPPLGPQDSSSEEGRRSWDLSLLLKRPKYLWERDVGRTGKATQQHAREKESAAVRYDPH